MAIVEFSPNKPIKPLFAVKLSPILQRLTEFLDEEESEDVLKRLLGIDVERFVKLQEIEDSLGSRGILLIIFDYMLKNKEPKYELSNEEGFFNFGIYNIDLNKDIDLEKVIADELAR